MIVSYVKIAAAAVLTLLLGGCGGTTWAERAVLNADAAAGPQAYDAEVYQRGAHGSGPYPAQNRLQSPLASYGQQEDMRLYWQQADDLEEAAVREYRTDRTDNQNLRRGVLAMFHAAAGRQLKLAGCQPTDTLVTRRIDESESYQVSAIGRNEYTWQEARSYPGALRYMCFRPDRQGNPVLVSKMYLPTRVEEVIALDSTGQMKRHFR